MKLEEVFGVSSKPVASYVQRSTVDDRFKEALKADKQIVVYGASKQGKTALVQAHLPYDQNLVVRLTPKTQIIDIYSSILRQLGIEIKETHNESTGREMVASIKVGFKALIPILGGRRHRQREELRLPRMRDLRTRKFRSTWNCRRIYPSYCMNPARKRPLFSRIFTTSTMIAKGN